MKPKSRVPDLSPLSPLTPVQIKALCSLAGVAFKRAKERGNDDETVEQFRHREQLAATGVPSLKVMNQEHYRRLKGHWLYLIGLLGEAFDLLTRTGEGQEQRELVQHHIAEAAANLAIAFQRERKQPTESAVDGAWHYVLKIARDKFSGRDLKSLDVIELIQVRDTTVNRTNAIFRRGKAENRNKKQREKAASPAAPTEGDDFAPFARREVPVAAETSHDARLP